MSTNKKIETLKTSIFNEYVSHFDAKLSDVLSFCESPIETLFLVQYINFFMKSFKGDYFIPFNGIEFKEERLANINKKRNEKIKKYNYRFDGVDGYTKYFGFKIQLGFTSSGSNHYYSEMEFYPQYEVEINNKIYRIDIAVIYITKAYFTDEIIGTRKIAIECDGFDYHNDPVKFREDKIRERHLKSLGWIEVLRYSGSEIFHIGDDLKKTQYNYEEMMTIFKNR